MDGPPSRRKERETRSGDRCGLRRELSATNASAREARRAINFPGFLASANLAKRDEARHFGPRFARAAQSHGRLEQQHRRAALDAAAGSVYRQLMEPTAMEEAAPLLGGSPSLKRRNQRTLPSTSRSYNEQYRRSSSVIRAHRTPRTFPSSTFLDKLQIFLSR